MSNQYTPQHISPEQLENVIAILNDQKKKEESETCLICFQDYLIKNTKDHQCPENWSCGACGVICEIEDGTVALNQGLKEFTHKAELCPAQDEIEEN